jgi:hypothetical protein
MPLEDVIAGAVSDAREDGVVGATDAVDAPVETPEPAPEDAPTEDAPAATEETPAPAAEVLAEPKTEDDALAKELGLKPRQDGKENRIPYSRVKHIVANAEKKAVEKAVAPVLQEVAEALGVDPATVKAGALKDVLASVKGAGSLPPELESEIQHMRQVETLVQQDPDTFIRALAQNHPAYQKFLTVLDAPAGAAASASSASALPKEMPAPDFDLGEGQKTYSVEGIQTLVQWAVNEGKKQAEEAISGRFRPIEEEFTARRTEAELAPKFKALMDEALTWDGFKEHADEILKVLQADTAHATRTRTRPKLTLDAAYRQVVVPKLKKQAEEAKAGQATEREKIRAELLAELKQAPTSTSTVAPVTPKPEAPTTLEGVIRQSVAGYKAKNGL